MATCSDRSRRSYGKSENCEQSRFSVACVHMYIVSSVVGTKSDPSNYSGICISSCIGTLFCSILNQRLLKHVDLHNINYKSQIGFLANNRTAADHVLTHEH